MKFKVLFFFFLIFIIPSKGESSTNTKIPKTYILFSTGVICGTDENGMIANKPRAIKYKDGCCSVDIEDGSGENWHKKGDLTDPHFLRELFPYDLGGNTPPKVYLERPTIVRHREKRESTSLPFLVPVLSVFLMEFSRIKTKYPMSCCLENDPYSIIIYANSDCPKILDPFCITIHEGDVRMFLELIINAENNFEKGNRTLSPEALNFKRNFIEFYGKKEFDSECDIVKGAYQTFVKDNKIYERLKQELEKKKKFVSLFIKNGEYYGKPLSTPSQFGKESQKLESTLPILNKIFYKLKFLKTKEYSMKYLQLLGFKDVLWVEDVESPTSGRKNVTLIYFTKPSS